MSQSFFNNFTSGEVSKDVVLLGYGKHRVIIHSVVRLTDRHTDLKGTLKAPELCPEWVDETDQIAVTFKGLNIETGEVTGVITHRYQGEGFTKYPELEALGLTVADYYSSGAETYAVHKGTDMRVHSPERTAKAMNIFNQFLEACNIEVGTAMSDDYRELKDVELEIEVFPRQYDGREIPRVKNPKSILAESPADAV